MAQGALGFQYVVEQRPTGFTAFGGLPAYLDLLTVAGLADSLDRHVGVCSGERGWTDAQIGLALVLLNLAGGTCVDDLDHLETDEGFRRLLLRVEHRHLRRRERRERVRKGRPGDPKRAVPSPTATRRWLQAFHDEAQEALRPAAGAFIPQASAALKGLQQVQRDLLDFAQLQRPEEVATLDLDATLTQTTKQQAWFCYKGFRAYQPLNVWWAEQELVVRSEFRDGNVPAGYENLRVLREALGMLPDRVETVRFRADTASYQWDLLRFMEEGKDPRFGRIEFAVGCNASPEFKAAVAQVPEDAWEPIYEYPSDPGKAPVPTGREWAQVDFVPGELQSTKKGTYRFYATRELLREPVSADENTQQELPFPTVRMRLQDYKIRGIVTNLKPEDGWDGEDVVRFLDQRMGRSEKAHAVMKDDLAGGQLPSKYFGSNAAWWQLMILTLNLDSVFRRHALGEGWVHRRMKAVRFQVIQVAGRVAERGHQVLLRLSQAAREVADLLIEARRRIQALYRMPPREAHETG